MEPSKEIKKDARPTAAPQRKFTVVARHSPCPVKSLTVDAPDEATAFAKFCEANKTKALDVARQAEKRKKESHLPADVANFSANRHLYPEVTITAA